MLEDLINALKSKNHQSIKSKKWKNWLAQFDYKICGECRKMHGKIFPITQFVPPAHFACRCVLEPLHAVAAGYVTRQGTAGADYWLKYYRKLPAYYITKNEARKNGWISE